MDSKMKKKKKKQERTLVSMSTTRKLFQSSPRNGAALYVYRWRLDYIRDWRQQSHFSVVSRSRHWTTTCTCWALYEKPNAFINTNLVYYLQVVWCCVSVFKQSVPLLSIKGLTSSLQDYSLRHRSSQGKQTFIYVTS